MEYQNIIKLLNNNNHPSKFRTQNSFKVNDDACGAYNTVFVTILIPTYMLR